MRGTQSFVGVMTAVWHRPSLTGIELLWRWGVGIPTLALCAWEALRIYHAVTVNTAALEAMTVFRPVDAAGTIAATLRGLAPAVLPVLVWLLPLALLARIVAAAIGRAAVQRGLDGQLRPKIWTLFCLSALRTAALLAVIACWVCGVRWANGFAITGPSAHGQEPNLVLFCATVIFGTLALFLVWAATMWIVDTAFVLAGLGRRGFGASLGGAMRIGAAKSKLLEINLVMGIVKVALLVLALVFSACPLPFETVETATFLACWWTGVGVLFLLASDYFHVVRTAAYLRLYQAFESEPNQVTRT